MIDPFTWLLSWCEISVPYGNSADILNLCMQNGVNHKNFKIYSEDSQRTRVSLICSKKKALLLARELEKRGVECEILREGGAAALIKRVGARSGLAVGFLLSLALLFLSGRVVWDIRVSGNETVSEDEVIEALRESGFTLGTRIDRVDINKLENRVSASSEKIAWISVNVSGTVANVQIRERKAADSSDTPTNLPSHLVSTFDGQIEELLVYEGWSAVKVGQAVRAGDILVSGKRETEDGKIYYTSASGEVLARVYKEFSVEIPIEYEVLEKDGEAYTEKYIKFFSKSVKIQKKGRKIPTSYDIIENEKEVSFFGGKKLPISITTVSYVPTKARKMTRTYQEATALAYEELNRLIAANCVSDQLLSKTISAKITDTSVVLRCEILCICNVAQRVEFTPEDAP